MEPINFKEANTTFTKPEGFSKEECGSLPTFNGKDGAGHDVMVSAWSPTTEEIHRMIAGKPVYLVIVGTVMPPVSITVDDIFGAEQAEKEIELPHVNDKSEEPVELFEYLGKDRFSRDVFVLKGLAISGATKKRIKLVDVDGILHTMSKDGEPDSPTKYVTPIHLVK